MPAIIQQGGGTIPPVPLGAPALGPDPILTTADVKFRLAGVDLGQGPGDFIPNILVRYGITMYSALAGAWNDPTIWYASGAALNRIPTSADNVAVQTAVTLPTGSWAANNIGVLDGGSLNPVNSPSTTCTLTCLTLMIYPKFSQTVGPFLNNHVYSLNTPNTGGLHQVGTPAAPFLGIFNCVFLDTPFTGADATKDPQQWTHGFLCLGQHVVCGVQRTAYARSAASGGNETTLTGNGTAGSPILLQSAVSNWQDGDALIMPDTTQAGSSDAQKGQFFETLAYKAAGSTSTSIVLNSALAHDHPGGYDVTNTLDTTCLPHLIHTQKGTSAYIEYRAQNLPSTNPPICTWADYAYPDIQYARFRGFGRTTCSPDDFTTFSANPDPSANTPAGNYGTVSHAGTNQPGRQSCNFYHLAGRPGQLITIVSTPNNGANQFPLRFANNYVDYWSTGLVATGVAATTATAKGKGAIVINCTQYGYFANNIFDGQLNAAGTAAFGTTGLVCDGTAELYNVIEGNVGLRIDGTGNRGDNSIPVGGTSVNLGPFHNGDTFYFAGPYNYIRNNYVYMNYLGTSGTAHGFNLWLVATGSLADIVASVVGYATSPGQDMSAWNTTSLPGSVDSSMNPSSIPLLQFLNNECVSTFAPGTGWWIGYTQNGINTSDNIYYQVGQSVVDGFKAWNCGGNTSGGTAGYWWFAYQAQSMKFTNVKVRSQKGWANFPYSWCYQYGWFPSDYTQGKMVIDNCDLQGCAKGIVNFQQTEKHDGTFVVQNCIFANLENFSVSTPSAVNLGGPNSGPSQTITFKNNTVLTTGGGVSTHLFDFDFYPPSGTGVNTSCNLRIHVQVYVNDVALTGHNWMQAYDVNQDPATNTVASSAMVNSGTGAPSAGQTNQHWHDLDNQDGTARTTSQSLSITGSPTSGTFTLAFGTQSTNGSQTTAAINWNDSAAAVQTALANLSNVGVGNVTCSGGPLPAAVSITFSGTFLAATLSDLNATIGTGPAVVGGTPTITLKQPPLCTYAELIPASGVTSPAWTNGKAVVIA